VGVPVVPVIRRTASSTSASSAGASSSARWIVSPSISASSTRAVAGSKHRSSAARLRAIQAFVSVR
jgi:hypothetical protein